MISIAFHQRAQRRRRADPRFVPGNQSSSSLVGLLAGSTTPTTTYCEPSQTTAPTNGPSGSQDEEDSCTSCLVVGLLTCTFLSGFFAHAAFDPPAPHETLQSVVKQRRPLYLGISAGWLVLGAYRLYLG